MKVVSLNRELKEDPIKEGARLLIAKWRRQNKIKAQKKYATKVK